jgi:feruloyl esterase
MRCGDLRSLSGFEYAVDSAADVADRPGVPEFCHIEGLIQPEVRFHVSLPRAWNGRLYMFGNGGFAGESLSSPGRLQRRDAALSKGFAVVSTNTGHDAAREPLATFAVHPQKLSDYAYRAVHVSVLAAKGIARHYYGAAPDRSYFEGCSTGGRQGLIAAQRFPEDFDGIVVGAPVVDFTSTMVSYVDSQRALAHTAIGSDLVKVLADTIYDKCDAVDGAGDGVIDDPRRCTFAPATDVPRCAEDAAGPACFTAAQVRALEGIYDGVSRDGTQVFPGWPVGAEVAAVTAAGARQTAWIPWFLGAKGAPSIQESFGQTFFRYLAFGKPDPAYDWLSFDVGTDFEKLEGIRATLDATSPDLSRFRARGGKILSYFGWADPALNPLMGLQYYERVVQTMGPSTPDFYRLFMVPGMFHCGGGIGVNAFDPFTTLVQWVERGAAPDVMPAARMVDGKPVRTRPLCPHPAVARYQGAGSLDDAASFTCVVP